MSQVNVDRIKSRAGTGSPTFTNGLVCSGVGTFSSQVSIAGTLTYEDVTNVDSVGIVTGRLGLRASGGGLDVVGVSTLTAAQADVATFTSNQSASVVYVKDTDGDGILISGSSAYGHRIYTNTTEDLLLGTNTTERVRINSAGGVGINTDTIGTNHGLDILGNAGAYAILNVKTASLGHGSAIELGEQGDDDYGSIYQFASAAGGTFTGRMRFIAGGTETLNLVGGKVGIGEDVPQQKLHINASDSGASNVVFTNTTTGTSSGDGFVVGITGGEDGQIWHQDASSIKFATADTERLRITSTGGLTLSNGELIEKCHIQSSPAWSSNGAVDLDNGVVQYNTTNYGSGGAGSLYFSSNAGINTSMATGDIMSLTMITNVNSTAGYINNIFIDNAAVTETWVGGSAPTAGGSSGVDIYTFNIIKTASATYTVIANHIKTS